MTTRSVLILLNLVLKAVATSGPLLSSIFCWAAPGVRGMIFTAHTYTRTRTCTRTTYLHQPLPIWLCQWKHVEIYPQPPALQTWWSSRASPNPGIIQHCNHHHPDDIQFNGLRKAQSLQHNQPQSNIFLQQHRIGPLLIPLPGPNAVQGLGMKSWRFGLGYFGVFQQYILIYTSICLVYTSMAVNKLCLPCFGRCTYLDNVYHDGI